MSENLNVANTGVAKPKPTGCLFVAPVGSTLPTDAKAELDPAFKSLGYINEDGIKQNAEVESTEHKAWGGTTVYQSIDNVSETFEFKLIEVLSPEVLKLTFGEKNVTGTGIETGISAKFDPSDATIAEQAVVIDMILRENVLKRIVIPRCKVTALGEINHDNELTGYPITLGCIKDSKLGYHTEYYNKKA